jgi:hypothetical protein
VHAGVPHRPAVSANARAYFGSFADAYATVISADELTTA